MVSELQIRFANIDIETGGLNPVTYMCELIWFVKVVGQ